MKESVQLERALRPLFIESLRRTMSAGGHSGVVPARNVRAFFSVVTNASGPVGKMYSYDGVELKKRTLAQIYDGEVRQREVTTLEEFLAIRKKLTTRQALCFGVPREHSRVRIAQQGSPEVLAGEAVARDREHFHFAERPGIFFTDYDPQPDVPPLGWKELDAIYTSVIPDWRRTKRAWVPSSSAYIYDKDGVELKGSRGWRCYMLVDRAASIPDLLAFLYQGLWERGHGLVTFAKDGHRLDRSLVDAVTGQPERLDFVAAVLADGLVCKAPPPKILKGRLAMLPTAKLVPTQTMQEWRKSSEKLTAARAAAIPQSDSINAAFVGLQVHREVARGADLQAARRKWQEATRGGTLGGDFELTLSDGAKMSVLEILSDPERWHGTRCYDPMAPDRNDDERIGVIYAMHRNLFSHAHQTTYRLDTRIGKVTYTESRLDLTTDHMIRALALHPYIFERGEDVATELVKRVGLSIVPYSPETLQDELRRLVETVTAVQTRSGYEEKPKDPPLTLCRTILAKSDRVGPG